MSVVVGDPAANERVVPLSLVNVRLSETHDVQVDGNRPGDFSAFDEGTTGWTIEADGFHTYASDDTLEAGLTSLRTLQESRTKVDAYVMRPNGRMLSGEAIITSVVEGGQYEGVLSGSYASGALDPLSLPVDRSFTSTRHRRCQGLQTGTR